MMPATTPTTPSAVNACALSAASQAVYDALADAATQRRPGRGDLTQGPIA